jgi:hypothetical protein
MMRLHLGARVIIRSWKQDLQVITAIKNFSRTLREQGRTEIIVNQGPLDHWNTPVTGTV